MFRYLALIWNSISREENDAAKAVERVIQTTHPLWTCQFSAPGLSVYCRESNALEGSAIILPNGAGIALGIIFTHNTSPQDTKYHHPIQNVSPKLTEDLLRSSGRCAIDAFWGSYVLIMTAKDLNERCVFRGPASQLACFHSTINGLHVFFSVVDDCVSIHPGPFTINWPVVRAQATEGPYLTKETCLNGITSIECGECIRHTEFGLKESFYWNPCTISQTRPIRRFNDAVSSLRNETLRVTHSWSSQYKSVLLLLSGGVDSSIILASLAMAATAPQIFAANFYSSNLPIDERKFARSMATRTGTPLFEIERNSPWDLSLLQRCARTARPVLDFAALGHLKTITELANSHGCDVVVDGNLGDEVFGYQPTAEPILDYLQRHGPLPGVAIVARDVARIKRLSIWRVLRESIYQCLHGSSCRSYLAVLQRMAGVGSEALRFVTREVLHEYYRESDRFVHPWLKEQLPATPSSVALIHGLILTTSTACHPPFSFARQPPYVRPLISQPLVEVALRIPGALSIRHGWSRAVARAAFSHQLSEEVLYRTSKTDMTPWARHAIRENLSWVREFLLEGVLVREGILDRLRIEAVLSDTVNNNDIFINHLFIPLYIEGWLRQWVT